MILADACDNFSLVMLTLKCDVLWSFVMLLLLRSYKDCNFFLCSVDISESPTALHPLDFPGTFGLCSSPGN